MSKQELLSKIQANINEYCDTYFDFSFDPKNPVVRLHEPTATGTEIFRSEERRVGKEC